MRKILCLLTMVLLSGLQAQAGPWSKAGKTKDELKEILSSMSGWNNDNMLRSIEVQPDGAFLVKTSDCEFSVTFDYTQSDPELPIKRELKSHKLSGAAEACNSFFNR